jgi:hypothetical protein
MAKPTKVTNRVLQFADTARRFCRLIDNRKRNPKRAFIHESAELIAELQVRFLRLLPVRTRFVAHKQHPLLITHEDHWRLMKSLQRKLGKDDLYHMVFDPYNPKPDDPIAHTLGDDLADIYDDLMKSLALIDQDDAHDKHDAVWTWKFHFLAHTGHHCVSALGALQELIERYQEED